MTWRVIRWAAGLLLLGAGALLLSTAFSEAPSGYMVGGNVPINVGALDATDISSHNSPSVARNPTDPENLVIANRIDTPRYSCAVHVSQDAGGTFSESPIPLPDGEEAKCYAPDIAFGADGTLYVSFVTLVGEGNVPHAVWLSSSKDGGRSFTVPTQVQGELAFQVRIAAHPSIPDLLYLVWLQADGVGLYRFEEPGNPIVVAVSRDAGRTWSSPKRVNHSARERVIAPVIRVSERGEIFVVYLDLDDNRLDYDGAHEGRGGPPHPGTFELVLARSMDQGGQWVETSVDDTVVPTQRFIVFIPPLPALALQPDGSVVHVSYHDASLGDADVWAWTSRDGGSTFGARTRVNDTDERDGTTQYLPQLDLAPDGRLDVLYYDRRSDGDDLMNEVSLQSSYDDGQTFTPRLVLSDLPFDSRVGFGAERELPDLGSRLGLLSTERRSLAVWTDTRAGTPESGKQDLVKEVIAFTSPPRLPATARALLQLGGVTAILAALVALGAAYRARRRAQPDEGSVAVQRS
jgi:hypothetical protein